MDSGASSQANGSPPDNLQASQTSEATVRHQKATSSLLHNNHGFKMQTAFEGIVFQRAQDESKIGDLAVSTQTHAEDNVPTEKGFVARFCQLLLDVMNRLRHLLASLFGGDLAMLQNDLKSAKKKEHADISHTTEEKINNNENDVQEKNEEVACVKDQASNVSSACNKHAADADTLSQKSFLNGKEREEVMPKTEINGLSSGRTLDLPQSEELHDDFKPEENGEVLSSGETRLAVAIAEHDAVAAVETMTNCLNDGPSVTARVDQNCQHKDVTRSRHFQEPANDPDTSKDSTGDIHESGLDYEQAETEDDKDETEEENSSAISVEMANTAESAEDFGAATAGDAGAEARTAHERRKKVALRRSRSKGEDVAALPGLVTLTRSLRREAQTNDVLAGASGSAGDDGKDHEEDGQGQPKRELTPDDLPVAKRYRDDTQAASLDVDGVGAKREEETTDAGQSPGTTHRQEVKDAGLDGMEGMGEKVTTDAGQVQGASEGQYFEDVGQDVLESRRHEKKDSASLGPSASEGHRQEAGDELGAGREMVGRSEETSVGENQITASQEVVNEDGGGGEEEDNTTVAGKDQNTPGVQEVEAEDGAGLAGERETSTMQRGGVAETTSGDIVEGHREEVGGKTGGAGDEEQLRPADQVVSTEMEIGKEKTRTTILHRQEVAEPSIRDDVERQVRSADQAVSAEIEAGNNETKMLLKQGEIQEKTSEAGIEEKVNEHAISAGSSLGGYFIAAQIENGVISGVTIASTEKSVVNMGDMFGAEIGDGSNLKTGSEERESQEELNRFGIPAEESKTDSEKDSEMDSETGDGIEIEMDGKSKSSFDERKSDRKDPYTMNETYTVQELAKESIASAEDMALNEERAKLREMMTSEVPLELVGKSLKACNHPEDGVFNGNTTKDHENETVADLESNSNDQREPMERNFEMYTNGADEREIKVFLRQANSGSNLLSNPSTKQRTDSLSDIFTDF